MALDAIDLRILDKLQGDATISSTDLADSVGLTQSPCWRRVSLLESEGVIERRVALLKRGKLGLGALVVVEVKLTDHGTSTLPALQKFLDSAPEVLQCFLMMGDVDFMFVIATKDIESYNQFMRTRLMKVPGIREITSRIVLDEIKNTTALPLGYALAK
jgi:Lrp/AsnC family transcriptional regulator